MDIKDIFNKDTDREEAKDAIKERIRNQIDEATNKKMKEKYGKKKEDSQGHDDKDEESHEEDYDGKKKESEDGEEEDEDDDEDQPVSESMQVVATRPGGRGQTEELTINRKSELNQLARTGQYEYFMVTDRTGQEKEYHVDPQGNLVEM